MRYFDLLSAASFGWIVWTAYWYVAARSVNAARSTESLGMRATHLLPLLGGFFLIFHRNPSLIHGGLYEAWSMRGLGLVLTLGGLAFAVWARVHLGRYWSGNITVKVDHELIRSGPYRLIRHPLYTGFLAAVVGSAVVAGTGDAMAGAALIIVAYLVKMRREEAVLLREFGERYREYRRHTWVLVPGVY